MLWEASVLDPNEVFQCYLVLSPTPANFRTGHSLPWPDHSRLSKSTPASTWWQGDHRGKYALALAHRKGSVSRADSRTIKRTCREGRIAPVPGEAYRLVSPSHIYSLPILCSFRLPASLHPMTQLGIGVAALNRESSFQAAYEKGMKKSEYWTHTLDDCINLIARLPTLAARIYRNVYKPGSPLAAIDKSLDLVGKRYFLHFQ